MLAHTRFAALLSFASSDLRMLLIHLPKRTASTGYDNISLSLAAALGNAQRHEESLARYDRELQSHPNDPFLLFNRAHSLAANNRRQEALVEYDKALNLAPVLTDALLGKAHTLRELGRKEEAIQVYATYLELRRDDDEARCWRAMCLSELY